MNNLVWVIILSFINGKLYDFEILKLKNAQKMQKWLEIEKISSILSDIRTRLRKNESKTMMKVSFKLFALFN